MTTQADFYLVQLKWKLKKKKKKFFFTFNFLFSLEQYL